MNNTDIYILLLVSVFALLSVVFLIFIQIKLRNRFKNPDEFLKNIEKQLSSKVSPKYGIISELKKAIELYPEHQGLIDKLNEVENSEVSNASPKAFFLILSAGVAIMGFAQVLASVFIKMKIYSFILGIIFIVGAYFLYQKSQNKNITKIL